jgi:hypothetical protein
MESFPMLLKLVIGAAALYTLYLFFAPKRNTTPLPPGPKPLPIVGNIADLPPAGVKEWKHWLKHKDLYGIKRLKRDDPRHVTNLVRKALSARSQSWERQLSSSTMPN